MSYCHTTSKPVNHDWHFHSVSLCTLLQTLINTETKTLPPPPSLPFQSRPDNGARWARTPPHCCPWLPCERWAAVGMAFHSGPPAYMIAVFAGVPAVILFLVLVALFVLCSKRYRLNWYERTLLEQDASEQTGPLLAKGPRASLFQKGGLFGGCKGGLMSGGGGRGRGARTGSVKSEWLFGGRKMGSSPSSPTAPTADASERFWVPPHLVERKRAQSLVPQLSRNDSDEGRVQEILFKSVVKWKT